MQGAPKVAVVTGAGSGIGRSVARTLVARGLRVALVGRSQSTLDETRTLVASDDALPFLCDVSNEADVVRCARDVTMALGIPDLIVHSAGIVHRAPVRELTVEQWRHTLDVNLTGVFLVTRAFLEPMMNRGSGRIVSVASISSTRGTPRLSAYCASKWGVVGFTKSLAEELRGTGVQTMCVLPGSVDTPMLRGSGFTPQMTADDVANTIAYIGLDAPDAMNASAVEIFGP